MPSMQCRCKDYCGSVLGRGEELGAHSQTIEAKYCARGGMRCARRVVFSIAGRDAVPDGLTPNDLAGAMWLLEGHWAENSRLPSAL